SGLLHGRWDAGTTIAAIITGVGSAVAAWIRPWQEPGVSDERWEALERSEQRAICAAGAGGEAVPEGMDAVAAVQIAEARAKLGLSDLLVLAMDAAFLALIVETVRRGA